MGGILECVKVELDLETVHHRVEGQKIKCKFGIKMYITYV